MQSNQNAPASELERLREEIDRLDDALLDLIEERLAASHAVARLKASEPDGWLRLRPKREAKIVARLAARARLASPRLINHVWRNLMAHSLQAQAPTELVLFAPGAAESLHAQVRERFGWAAPMSRAESPEEAIAVAAAREAVAIIAHNKDGSWWTELEALAPVRIFDSARAEDGTMCAFYLGRIAEADVPEDQRFTVVEAGSIQDTGECVAQSGDLRLCLAPAAPSAQEAAR